MWGKYATLLDLLGLRIDNLIQVVRKIRNLKGLRGLVLGKMELKLLLNLEIEEKLLQFGSEEDVVV